MITASHPPRSTARLHSILPALKPAERRLAEYLLEHGKEIIQISIMELAYRTQVSEATVIRLCRKLGFKGYQDLKIGIAQELVEPNQRIHELVANDDDIETVKRKVFAASAAALHSTLGVLDDKELTAAVSAFNRAEEIVFFGVGSSGWVCQDAAQRFLKLGWKTYALIDGHAQAVKASLLDERSVAVGISHSGSSKDTVQALSLAKKAGATTVCITTFGRSPITKVADIKLFTASQETAFKTESMSSRVAQVAIIDTLFVACALARYELAVRNIQQAREATADKRY